MELKPSYRLTDIGPLPSDWDVVRLEELYLEPSRNGLNRPQRVRGQGFKMVNMRELFAYDLIADQEMERVPMTQQEISKYSLKRGDLLFARQSIVASGAGKCSIVSEIGETMTFESHIIRVRLKQRKAKPEYFYHLFRSDYGYTRIQSLVTQIAAAGIRGSELAKVLLPLPPLPEQRAIAEALSDVDAQMSALDRLIAKKRGFSGEVINTMPVLQA